MLCRAYCHVTQIESSMERTLFRQCVCVHAIVCLNILPSSHPKYCISNTFIFIRLFNCLFNFVYLIVHVYSMDKVLNGGNHVYLRCVFIRFLRCISTSPSFAAIFTKGSKVCGICFASLDKLALSNGIYC